jgi:HAD superfamily hydrolase (TIGR01509 family)
MVPALSHVSAIVFDLDGTLIDSNAAHAETWAQALSEHGFPREVVQIRLLIGMGSDKLLPMVTGLHEGSPEGQAIARRKKELFTARRPELQPTRGVRALVQHLHDQRKTIVVATSADEEEMHAILERAGVDDLIPKRTSSDDANRSKPDPDIVLAALTRARTPREKTLMVGDTPYDVEAARRAGLATIALRCGGHWADAELGGAIAILDDPAALLAAWRS